MNDNTEKTTQRNELSAAQSYAGKIGCLITCQETKFKYEESRVIGIETTNQHATLLALVGEYAMIRDGDLNPSVIRTEMIVA